MFYPTTTDRSVVGDLRHAFVDLLGLGHDSHAKYYRLTQVDGTPLSEHPFGLEVIPKSDMCRGHPITLVSTYGDQTTVEAMLTVLRQFLEWHAQDMHFHGYSFRLRMIRVTREGGTSQDVYFELDSARGTYLCSGCTDGYAGMGPTSTKYLRRAFDLVSLLFAVPFEEILIEDPSARDVRRALEDQKAEYRRRNAE